jgi:hypothetical protein
LQIYGTEPDAIMSNAMILPSRHHRFKIAARKPQLVQSAEETGCKPINDPDHCRRWQGRSFAATCLSPGRTNNRSLKSCISAVPPEAGPRLHLLHWTLLRRWMISESELPSRRAALLANWHAVG